MDQCCKSRELKKSYQKNGELLPAYQIYEKVTGQRLESVQEDLGGFGKTEQELLQQVCTKNNVPYRLISNLLNVEFESQGATRHSKVFGEIQKQLSREWRQDINEIVQELTEDRKIQDTVRAFRRPIKNQSEPDALN